MNIFGNSSNTRETTVNGLAVVGFVALVVLGMWLAVASTRFVPPIVNRIGAAAVYLGSIFTPAEGPSLSVVPTASTTIPFGTEATSTTSTEATTTAATSTVTLPTSPTKPVKPTAGQETSSTVQIGGSTGTPTLYGYPDLVVNILSVGYLASASADTFVASSTVPSGSRPAVKFSIKNVGTNVAAPWRFSASIPAQTAYVYQSPSQQALNPGDSIEYTLGFDQANKGTDQMISVTANFDNSITESTTNNNSASTKITILGS